MPSGHDRTNAELPGPVLPNTSRTRRAPTTQSRERIPVCKKAAVKSGLSFLAARRRRNPKRRVTQKGDRVTVSAVQNPPTSEASSRPSPLPSGGPGVGGSGHRGSGTKGFDRSNRRGYVMNGYKAILKAIYTIVTTSTTLQRVVKSDPPGQMF